MCLLKAFNLRFLWRSPIGICLSSNGNQVEGICKINIEFYDSAIIKAEPGSKPVTARPRVTFLCQHPVALGLPAKKKPILQKILCRRIRLYHERWSWGCKRSTCLRSPQSLRAEPSSVETANKPNCKSAALSSFPHTHCLLQLSSGSVPHAKEFGAFGKCKSLAPQHQMDRIRTSFNAWP